MYLAPLGVAAAMAVTVGGKGFGVLFGLGKLIALMYASLLVFVVCWEVLSHLAPVLRIPPFAIPSVVKIAKSFSRLGFAMVAGRQMSSHPCCRERHYILAKLMEFHTSHGSLPQTMRDDLEAAIPQLPAKTRREEIKPLEEHLEELKNRRGPQPLAKIIPLVLAKLGLRQVQLTSEGEGPG